MLIKRKKTLQRKTNLGKCLKFLGGNEYENKDWKDELEWFRAKIWPSHVPISRKRDERSRKWCNQIWKRFSIKESGAKNNSQSKGTESILFTHFLSFLIGKSLPLTCFLSIDTIDSERGMTSKVRY